jgi:hypothetical protein
VIFMSAAQAGKGAATSDAATVNDIVVALGEIAAELARNTAELQAFQRAGDFGRDHGRHRPGERPASIRQQRTILDYLVLGALVGRPGSENLTVRARRHKSNGHDQVTILAVPDDAVTVSVQAADAAGPELLSLPKGGAADKTVTLKDTKDKDIARLELLNRAGEPIRLGPRMVRLPADAPVA